MSNEIIQYFVNFERILCARMISFFITIKISLQFLCSLALIIQSYEQQSFPRHSPTCTGEWALPWVLWPTELPICWITRVNNILQHFLIYKNINNAYITYLNYALNFFFSEITFVTVKYLGIKSLLGISYIPCPAALSADSNWECSDDSVIDIQPLPINLLFCYQWHFKNNIKLWFAERY